MAEAIERYAGYRSAASCVLRFQLIPVLIASASWTGLCRGTTRVIWGRHLVCGCLILTEHFRRRALSCRSVPEQVRECLPQGGGFGAHPSSLVALRGRLLRPRPALRSDALARSNACDAFAGGNACDAVARGNACDACARGNACACPANCLPTVAREGVPWARCGWCASRPP